MANEMKKKVLEFCVFMFVKIDPLLVYSIVNILNSVRLVDGNQIYFGSEKAPKKINQSKRESLCIICCAIQLRKNQLSFHSSTICRRSFIAATTTTKKSIAFTNNQCEGIARRQSFKFKSDSSVSFHLIQYICRCYCCWRIFPPFI